jgi:hypothetical protein
MSRSMSTRIVKTLAALAGAGITGCLVYVACMEFGAVPKTPTRLLWIVGAVSVFAPGLIYTMLELTARSAAKTEIRPSRETSTLTFPPKPRLTARR